MGAEDYIVKPFDIIELIARVEIVLRRYHKLDEIFHIAGLTIDTVSMTGHLCGCIKRNKYCTKSETFSLTRIFQINARKHRAHENYFGR